MSAQTRQRVFADAGAERAFAARRRSADAQPFARRRRFSFGDAIDDYPPSALTADVFAGFHFFDRSRR